MAGDITLYDSGGGSRGPFYPRFQPPPGPNPPNQPQPHVGRNELGNILRRRCWSIVFGFVSVLGAVTLFLLLWPKTFESTALVMVQPKEAHVGTAFFERPVQNSQVETEIELMKSRRVIDRAVDELDLHVRIDTGLGLSNGLFRNGLDRLTRKTTRVHPSDVFLVFDAGTEAQAGLFRVEDHGEEGVVVRDLEADTVVAQVAPIASSEDPRERAIWFAGYVATPTEQMPRNGVTIQAVNFSRAVENAQSLISASRLQPDADLIQLKCSGATPALAHDLCEQVLDHYVQLRTDLQRVQATTTAEFLRGQVTNIGQQLESAEDQLETYRSQRQIVDLEEHTSAEVRQFTDLKASRDQLDAERMALAEMIQNIRAGVGGTGGYRDIASFPTFLTNQAVTQILASLTELESERSVLVLRQSDDNTDVLALDTRIIDLEQRLLSIATSYQSDLTEQIRSIDQNLYSLGARLAVNPGQQVNSARLEREILQLQALNNTLQTRLREVEVAETVHLPSIRVVDSASFPLDAASPNVRRNISMGIFLGLASGLALAFFREFRDETIHGREEVEQSTGLPVLIMLPRVKQGGGVLRVPKLGLRLADSDSIQNDVGVTPPTIKPSVFDRIKYGANGKPKTFSFTKDKQVALESFRSLATDLRLAARHWGGEGRIIAVTSPARGEGKTFTSCNLGLVQASQGARTLVIDADMRAQGVSEFFEVSPDKPGLTDLLADRGEINGIWKAQLEGEGSELWVMPSGNASLYKRSLLETKKFEHLLARARHQFDLTVIDTPPINLIADATTVAAVADAVIVIVRGGKTDRTALGMAMARLERCGGNVIGYVLNDVDLPDYYLCGNQYEDQWQGTTGDKGSAAVSLSAR